MNPAALSFVLNALESLPQLIAAGQNIAALVTTTTASLKAMQAENRDPTAAEWHAQISAISDLRAALHAA